MGDFALGCIVAIATGMCALSGLATEDFLFYARPLDPKEHPAYGRYHAKPVDPALMRGRYEFVSMKGDVGSFTSEKYDRMTRELDCGRIVHPTIHSMFGPGRERNLTNLVHEVRQRDLILSAPWWQVPAWGSQVHPTRDQYDYLERELGEAWLGMENGEQDGRYLKSFTLGKWPRGGKGRFGRYLDFNRFFDRLSDWMGDRMVLFSATTLTPYLLREGVYTCHGMETSQHHANTQVSYAFIRGAGKQYGVPWYGDVSLYGRWGWKNNLRSKVEPATFHDGREDMGTSYSLMKRLAYEQYFHNCLFGSMEGIQFDEQGRLFGSGRILRDLMSRRDKLGDPGVMYTPVALVVDSNAGWMPPRADDGVARFAVWGGVPWREGDYLTHGIFDVLYPGYEAGFEFRDERGYMVGTPYGDIADAILSDAPAWLLRRYALVVLAGEIEPSAEFTDVLAEYLAGGGRLLLTEGNRRLLPSNAQGAVTIIPGTAWGVERNPDFVPTRYDIGRKRYGHEYDRYASVEWMLTRETRRALESAFEGVRLFGVSESPETNGVSIVACRRKEGEWSVALFNNGWEVRPFDLFFFGGEIAAVEEIPTVTLDRSNIGYLPQDTAAPKMGEDSPTTIAGGSVRTFRVRVHETQCREIAQTQPSKEPKNRTLSLLGNGSLREHILRRPTFFRHFDGVKVDARYFHEISDAAAAEEAHWLRIRKVAVMVDFTDFVDRFSGLRIAREDSVETARSDAMLDGIVRKLRTYGVKDAVFALTHVDHNSMSSAIPKNSEAAYVRDARRMVEKIREVGCAVHLRMSRHHVAADFGSLDRWSKILGLRRTFSLASALALERAPLCQGLRPLPDETVRREAASRTGDLWLLSAPCFDANNEHEVSLEASLVSDAKSVSYYLELAHKSGVRVVFDAAYADRDAEYRDARFFESLGKKDL